MGLNEPILFYSSPSYSGSYNLDCACNKNPVFWDITSCSPLKVTKRFGGTLRLYLQGGK
jgi:hypothetical protein